MHALGQHTGSHVACSTQSRHLLQHGHTAQRQQHPQGCCAPPEEMRRAVWVHEPTAPSLQERHCAGLWRGKGSSHIPQCPKQLSNPTVSKTALTSHSVQNSSHIPQCPKQLSHPTVSKTAPVCPQHPLWCAKRGLSTVLQSSITACLHCQRTACVQALDWLTPLLTSA